MIFGMSISAFTQLHVVISLVAIVAGIVVVAAMLGSKMVSGWTALFLATTVLTSVTGYFFPADRVLPSHIVGGISLLVLVLAIAALYGYRFVRSWRWIYVVGAVMALYLNVFVLVAQGFQKIAFLNALAPTQSDPGFVISQSVVLIVFVVVGITVVRSFHPETGTPTLRPA